MLGPMVPPLLTAALLVLAPSPASAPALLLGQEQESSPPRWHGHERLDFEVAGKPARLVVPTNPAPGRPWVWRARFPDFHAGPDRILLERGFHIAHVDTGGMLGGPKAMAIWDRFYEVTSERTTGSRPGRPSRG